MCCARIMCARNTKSVQRYCFFLIYANFFCFFYQNSPIIVKLRRCVLIFYPFADDALNERTECFVSLTSEEHRVRVFGFEERCFGVGAFDLREESVFEILELLTACADKFSLFGCHSREFIVCVKLGVDDLCSQATDVSEQAYIRQLFAFWRVLDIVSRVLDGVRFLDSFEDDFSAWSAELFLAHDDIFAEFAVDVFKWCV